MNAIIAALEGSVSKQAAVILATILSMFSSAILQLTEDEVSFFVGALNSILADVKAGKGWEVSFTAALTEFYGDQVQELGKAETAILEYIAKFADAIKSAL